jgi:hypothetical protein
MHIMMNISKLHAGTSHGIKNEESRMGSIFAGLYLQKSPYCMWDQAMESRMGGHVCKMQGIEREKSTGITVLARTDSGDRGPEDATKQKA